MAKHKYIESPEQYKQIWEDYKKSVKEKPKLKHTFVGKDGNAAYEERERPITWDGFEVYTMLMGYNTSADLSEYCNESNPSYIEYLPLSRAFKKECRVDHIDGGMTGIYPASLTANINGITTKTDNKNENTNIEIKANFGGTTLPTTSQSE
jgi:hypothetical protein